MPPPFRLQVDVEEEPEASRAVVRTSEACLREIESVVIPPELESADRMVKIAYRYLKYPDAEDKNVCWALNASDDKTQLNFSSTRLDNRGARSFRGSMKSVSYYPDDDGETVLVSCRPFLAATNDCIEDFHEESSKHILLYHFVQSFLESAAVPEEEKIRFARVSRVFDIGYLNNDSFVPFRIDERIERSALDYLRSIKDEMHRQQQFCAILLQVMNTVKFLREHCGFVHGDLKLDNIGVKIIGTQCVQSYLLDFGLSCMNWNGILVGSRVSPYFGIRNPNPVQLLPNDMLYLLSSSVTKIHGLFALGCADQKRCVLEKMILFILTTIGEDDANGQDQIVRTSVVYEPTAFMHNRARILSPRNVEAITCTLILNYKSTACGKNSSSADERLNRCQHIVEEIATEITRASSPLWTDGITPPDSPRSSSPPMMVSERPSSANPNGAQTIP